MNIYQEKIMKQPGTKRFNPRHIEALIRLDIEVKHLGKIESLTEKEFADEVKTAILIIKEAGPAVAEKFTKVFGL